MPYRKTVTFAAVGNDKFNANDTYEQPRWSNTNIPKTHQTFVECVRNNPDALKQLLRDGVEIDPFAVQGAATSGNLSCLRLALDNGAPFDPEFAGLVAVQHGRLPALQYIVNEAVNRFGVMRWHPSALVWAAMNGHVHCVSFLLAHAAPTQKCINEALYFAARRKHLYCIIALQDALE